MALLKRALLARVSALEKAFLSQALFLSILTKIYLIIYSIIIVFLITLS